MRDVVLCVAMGMRPDAVLNGEMRCLRPVCCAVMQAA
jgi:hypothetical protein